MGAEALAEEVRFELTEPFDPPVFKTGALSLYAILPWWARGESNPQNRVSKTRTYASSVTGPFGLDPPV